MWHIPGHSNLAPDDKRILYLDIFILSEVSHDVRSAPLGPVTIPVRRLRLSGHGSWLAPAQAQRNQKSHMGYIWVGLMAIVAFSGFFIHVLNWSDPSARLSAVRPYPCQPVVCHRAARRGDIKRHRQTMVTLFWMA